MRRTALLAALLGFLTLSGAAIAAGDPGNPTPQRRAAAANAKRELTPEELAEKEARKACKKKICDIIATRDPAGDDVSCDIVKTWREDDIVKMLGGKIGWPWGKAVCQSRLEVKRKDLALAMSEPAYDMTMPTQKVRCTLAQKDGGDALCHRGHARRRRRNSRTARRPRPASIGARPRRRSSSIRLIYAGTGLDNSANVLGPEVVRMINEFTTKKCAEVKADASSKPRRLAALSRRWLS